MLAQLKFLATYMVPSLYPSLLTLCAIVLGAFAAPPAGSEMAWSLNALAWIGVLTLIATLALTLKRLFGRQPSLNEVLSGLVTVANMDVYKEEQRLRSLGLETQISAARHAFDERVNMDLRRTLEMFKELSERAGENDRAISGLSKLMERMQERTETHLRKFDQYDTKFDNLLREVSRAAAAGVRSAQQ